jgi:hypothetical protein
VCFCSGSYINIQFAVQRVAPPRGDGSFISDILTHLAVRREEGAEAKQLCCHSSSHGVMSRKKSEHVDAPDLRLVFLSAHVGACRSSTQALPGISSDERGSYYSSLKTSFCGQRH